MTFDQLVREVAVNTAGLTDTEITALRSNQCISLDKIREIVKETFAQIHNHVLENNGEIAVPSFGRFITKAKRNSGLKPDGTRWNKPGRTQLALKASPSASVKGNKPAPLAAVGT